MDYQEKYPNAKPTEMVENDILVSDKEEGCMVCRKPTRFIDVISEGYVCSPECKKEWYKFFFSFCEHDDPSGV
jgi:hypothetical protein